MTLDSATPMLNELLIVSQGYAIDALNYASLKMQSGMKSKSLSYGTSPFGVTMRNKRRLLVSSDKKGNKGSFFSRFSHSTAKDLDHGLENFIKFRVYEKTLKSVIGFINVKSFSANLYKDGRKYGTTHVKGQGRNPKVKNSEKIKEIGEKMERGGIFKLSDNQRGLFYRSGWIDAANAGYINRKARPVVQPVFQSMSGKIDGIFKEKYAEALVKHSAKTFQPQKRQAS